MEACLANLKTEYEPCPGLYCGRWLLNATSCLFSNCQKCPRGHRPNGDWCQPCLNSPSLYDYMYLGFMLNMSVVLQFINIDYSFSNVKKRKNNLNNYKIMVIYLLPVFECLTAFLSSILLFPPMGKFNLHSCAIDNFFDWYNIFFNPSIDYYHKLNCTQEIVYPLYTINMLFFILALGIMLVVRPFVKKLILNNQILNDYLDMSTFSALYLYPLMFLIHVLGAGIIYYTFPIITAITFLISNNVHLSHVFKNQLNGNNRQNSYWMSCLRLFKKTKNIVIQVIHFYFFTFSIISFTQLSNYSDLAYLAFVPVPLVFFIVSYAYSNPSYFN